MAVSNRHILQQGPVLGALARAVFSAATAGNLPKPPLQVPGPELKATIQPRPKELISDYIRHVGGDTGAYRGRVPHHLFPQWVLPLQSQGLERVPYPMHKILNGGCRLEMNAPLPAGKPFDLSVRLENIDDNGRRAVIRQRVITATKNRPQKRKTTRPRRCT